MRLCGFIVLLLGLGFLLAVLSPQSMRASPVCMPITACAALASQVENIRVISSDQLDAAPMGGMRFRVQASRLISAFRGDAKHAPRLFSTSPNASKALAQSGNVGIGTTSPTTLLQITGGSSTNFNFDPSASTSSYSTSFVMDNTGLKIGHNSAFRDIEFQTNSSTAMTISSGGKVGIGLTNPATALHVYNNAATQLTVSGYGGSTADNSSGKIAIGGNTSYQGILQYSDTGSSYFYIDNNYDNAAATTMLRMRTNGTPVNAITILGSGNVGIGTTSPVSKLTLAGGNFITPSADSTSAIGFASNAAPTTPILNIDTTDARVGIGLTNPLAPLQVVNGTGPQFVVGLDRLHGLKINNWGNTDVNIDPMATSSNIHLGRDVSTAQWTFESGNVGIGTTSPVSKLTLAGGNFITPSADSTSAIGFASNAAPTTPILNIDTTDARVGIGLTNPLAPLQVVNGTGPQFVVGLDRLHGLKINNWGNTDVNIDPMATSSNIHLGRDVSTAQWTFESGNVGIVFTSPFSPPPIASIAAATQATFPNLSGQAKRNQNPAHGMVMTAAARDLGHLFRVRLNQKAA